MDTTPQKDSAWTRRAFGVVGIVFFLSLVAAGFDIVYTHPVIKFIVFSLLKLSALAVAVLVLATSRPTYS